MLEKDILLRLSNFILFHKELVKSSQLIYRKKTCFSESCFCQCSLTEHFIFHYLFPSFRLMQEHWTFSISRPPFIRSLFTIVLYCSCWSYFMELLKHLKPKIRYCLVVNILDHSSKKQIEECIIRSRCSESSHWRAGQNVYQTLCYFFSI